jgi:hypothetical protein
MLMCSKNDIKVPKKHQGAWFWFFNRESLSYNAFLLKLLVEA